MDAKQEQTFAWTLDESARGIRLDVWLDSQLADISRSRLKALIDAGHVTRNDTLPKTHQKLVAGDRISITIPAAGPLTPQPENIPLNILHQDDDIAVIDKPPRCVVHPAPGHESGTLVNALLYHFPQLSELEEKQRPGIVHRLDQDTSGVIVVALTRAAAQGLVEQFKGGTVQKQYDAIVSGHLQPERGRIETHIGRHPVHRKRMAVCETGGKNAITEYRQVESFGGGKASLQSVRIETGRTHQIRVHMAHLGHPVLGDAVYARRRSTPWPERQMLHARRIQIHQPRTSALIDIEAQAPADMRAFLDQLRALES